MLDQNKLKEGRVLLKAKGIRLIFYFAIFVGGVLPIVFYWFYIGRVPSLTPREAVELLDQPGSAAVLIDIRTPEEFRENRLNGARNWPFRDIMSLVSRDYIPEEYAEKHLILLCKSGIKSALAVQKLKKLDASTVNNIRGGMEAWVANPDLPYNLDTYKIHKKYGEIKLNTMRETPLFQQWVIVTYGFVIKYAYMFLSLVLIIWLWRTKPLDLKALKWGMLFFLVGESFCALNSYVYKGESLLFDYFHSFGMVLSFGFVTFAILEGIDQRIVKVAAPEQKCAALGLCRSCIKYTDAPCGLKRLFVFITPACMALAFIPLTAVPHWSTYNTYVFKTFLNHSNPIVNQIFEIRFCPIFAIILLIPTLIVLLIKKEDPITPSKVLFSGAMGYLGFGLFRLFLYGPYREQIMWKAFWEELTELLFILGVGITLWIFRYRLFQKKKES